MDMFVSMDRGDAEAVAQDILRRAVERRRETGEEVQMIGFLVVPAEPDDLARACAAGESFATTVVTIPLHTAPTRRSMRAAFSRVAASLDALAAVVLHESWGLDLPKDDPDEARRLFELRQGGTPICEIPGHYEAITCTLEHPLGVMIWQARLEDDGVENPDPMWIEADDAISLEGEMINLSGLVRFGIGSPTGEGLPAVGDA